MQNKHLYFLTLIVALLGMSLLWFIEPHYQPQSSLFMHCTGSVSFEGVVEHIEEKENFFILTLRDTSFFDVIAFELPSSEVGQRVTVIGIFQEYRGEPQIVASQVKLFK